MINQIDIFRWVSISEHIKHSKHYYILSPMLTTTLPTMLSVLVNNDRSLTSGKYQPSRNGYYDVAVTAATVTFLY